MKLHSELLVKRSDILVLVKHVLQLELFVRHCFILYKNDAECCSDTTSMGRPFYWRATLTIGGSLDPPYY